MLANLNLVLDRAGADWKAVPAACSDAKKLACLDGFWHHSGMRIFPACTVAALVIGSDPASYAAVTFNHDVAPVLYHNCTYCHRPGEAAPFSLLTYRDAEKKGKTIAKVIFVPNRLINIVTG